MSVELDGKLDPHTLVAVDDQEVHLTMLEHVPFIAREVRLLAVDDLAQWNLNVDAISTPEQCPLQ